MALPRIAVVGASGYTGAELIRLLRGHPALTLGAVVGKRAVGQPLAAHFPHLTGLPDLEALTVEAFDPVSLARDHAAVLVALPHGDAASAVAALRHEDALTIDLSADFRLRDPATWQAWYGDDAHPGHPAAALLADAVYGLVEHARARLRTARLIAVPGCFPTASILALAPLLAHGLVQPRGIIIDAKTGVSGAGRSAGQPYHFPEMGEGVRAYKVGGSHRHTPEIEQALSAVAGVDVRVLFTPHLVPMSRGILACVYATPTDPGRPAEAYREALIETYRAEPFIHVLPPGQAPDTSHVRGSNQVHVNAWYDARSERVVTMAALDNLVKGASGQAVQCLNLALGLDETAGLAHAPLFP